MPDVEAAWRFLLVNWIFVGAMGVVLALCLAFTNFSLELTGLAISVGYVGLYAGFAHANAISPKRRDPQVMFVLGGTAQIVLITAVMTPLTYVAASANLPMQDANLLAIDRALGFDWGAYVRYVDDHPALAAWVNYGYTMIRWPIFAIPVVLAATHRYRRIEEFTFAFGVALIVTTIISGLVPAINRSDSIRSASRISICSPISTSGAICRRPATAPCVISIISVSAASSPFRASTPLPPCSMPGRCGRRAGCGPSWCWPSPPCWRRRRSTAGIISSTSSRAPRSRCWRSSRRARPDGSSPSGRFALRTARWFLSRSGRNKAQRIAADAGRGSAKARCMTKTMTITTAARPTWVFT
jgi:hypothetical protein